MRWSSRAPLFGRAVRASFLGVLHLAFVLFCEKLIINSRAVLFNRHSAKHVVGFREGSSFFSRNDFFFSMLISHYVIFVSSMNHYVIIQFTVLYLVVVESRKRTRAAVSCSAFVGIK